MSLSKRAPNTPYENDDTRVLGAVHLAGDCRKDPARRTDGALMAYTIQDWPESERPREKLVEHGAAGLSTAELLAILLRVGGADKTALDLGRQLLRRYDDSIQKLEEASITELCEINGIGPAKAAGLKAALEIAKRYAQTKMPRGATYRTSADVYHHYRGQLGDLKTEEFHMLLLDAKNQKLKDVRVSQGSLTAAIVHPREVFHHIVRESAAAAILVHNHPSGDPTPSQEDVNLTRRLRKAGEMMGVSILDHLVISRGGYVSFVDDGYWE